MAQIAMMLALGAAGGCSSARMSDRETDNLFRDGRYDEAAERLKKGLADQGENGRDLLLYLLDLGLTLHQAGKFDESNQYFLKADKIAEIKDYTSLATEGATFLTSDNIKDYKGEDFEKVLINTYLAMNYAMKGDTENALVEARRVNRKLLLMVTEGKRKYHQSAFARYLSGILYESEGAYNDAYLDYKSAYELEPGIPGIGRDLWRTAKVSGLDDAVEKWEEEFHLSEDDKLQAKASLPKSGRGELIVIYENGISPIKKPNPQFYSLPKFFPRYNPVSYAQISVNGQVRATTARLHDIESTAIENLEEKYGGLIAKKIGGIVAKELVGAQIERSTNSPLLGAIAKFALYASDQADVRSWNLLPRDLQIARIPLEPGTYQVQATPVGGGALPTRTVQIRAGKKAFLDFRFMP